MQFLFNSIQFYFVKQNQAATKLSQDTLQSSRGQGEEQNQAGVGVRHNFKLIILVFGIRNYPQCSAFVLDTCILNTHEV